MMDRNRGGFTLLELLIVILTGSIVTLGAVTVLLLGLRVNNQSTGVVARQNTARILLTALENLASEGNITKITYAPDSWKILGEDGENETVLFSYSDAQNAVYTGEAGENNPPLLNNVIASHVSMNDKNVLTFSVETEDGSYSTSVLCRQAVTDSSQKTAADTTVENLVDETEDNDAVVEEDDTSEARNAYLKVLASQLRLKDGSTNPGLVLKDGYSTGWYYAQWYIGTTDNPSWNKDTPWCACFASWGLAQVADKIETTPDGQPRWFASVDHFMNDLKDGEAGTWHDSCVNTPEGQTIYEPVPGDIIFIDWSGGTDPAHVGVVLTVDKENGIVYTIEGNSAGIVAIRQYALNSPIVMGYGVIDWKSNS